MFIASTFDDDDDYGGDDDARYCIDNGAMIAQAGIFSYQMNSITPLVEATCTQRCVLFLAC